MSSTLILNADGNPLSMIPLSTITWKEAIIDLIQEKSAVLEWYDDWIVRSPSWETRVPAVMILKNYEKKKLRVRFSSKNVFIRDGYECQYCGVNTRNNKPTIDHILPISLGGKTTFENVVCACGPCNSRKGNNKSIRPLKMPIKPTYYQLIEQQKKMPIEIKHPSWVEYLGINR